MRYSIVVEKIRSTKQTIKPETFVEKTGKSREAWAMILDRFDVKKNGHTAAAKYLYNEHSVSYWWAQTLVVDYEQERGLRAPGQRSKKTFSTTVTKTVPHDLETCWQAFTTAKAWNGWFTTGAKLSLKEGGKYQTNDHDHGQFKKICLPDSSRKGTEKARLEFTWENAVHCPGTLVIVQFFDKGPDKTMIAITHDRIADEQGVQDMKTGWTWAVASLAQWLQTGKGLPYEEWEKTRKR